MKTHHTYHIPANFTDAGKLFGLFGIRNAIEALLLAGPCAIICFRFLPLDISGKVMAALVTGIPLGGFALIGIQDDPLSRFLMAWWRWRRSRGAITFRGSPEQDEKRKRARARRKVGSA